jgi:hypothetical protein
VHAVPDISRAVYEEEEDQEECYWVLVSPDLEEEELGDGSIGTRIHG